MLHISFQYSIMYFAHQESCLPFVAPCSYIIRRGEMSGAINTCMGGLLSHAYPACSKLDQSVSGFGLFLFTQITTFCPLQTLRYSFSCSLNWPQPAHSDTGLSGCLLRSGHGMPRRRRRYLGSHTCSYCSCLPIWLPVTLFLVLSRL